MAPEQGRGETVDCRCDLFSLGCVLYRLCTGQMPFRGDTTFSLLMSVATDKPRPAQEVVPNLPPALVELIDQLLAKDPQQRPASAKVVVERIQAIERGLASRAGQVAKTQQDR